MRPLRLTLPPDSDLRLSIQKISSKEKSSGFVLGIVGNLSQASFQCPGRPEPTVMKGNLEIINLNGSFSPEGVHLHLSLSDADCQVWGGHLEEGTIVFKGADILLGLLNESEVLPSSEIDNSTANSSPRVEIFVLPDCPWSSRALRILRTLDIPHTLKIINNDEMFNQLKQRSNLTTFPQIFIDNKLIGGYEQLADLHGSGKLSSFR